MKNKKDVEKEITKLGIKSFSNKNPRIDLNLLKKVFLEGYSEQLRLDENLSNFIETCKKEKYIESSIRRAKGEAEFPAYELSWSYLDKFQLFDDTNIEFYFGEVPNEILCYYEGFLKILFMGKEIAIIKIQY